MDLAGFRRSLRGGDIMARLRGGLIGEGVPVPGPFGEHPLVYADYTASGRALRPVEDFIAEHVLPYYANSHTEASFCGARMTALRDEARSVIAKAVNAGPDETVIFTGAGATSAVNRLVSLLALDSSRTIRPLVLIGPYEHHSNILPWRESGAEVVEVPEADGGGPDLVELELMLFRQPAERLVIGAFSAASNVTGIKTDVDAVTALLKRYGALAVWDYAGGGPYLPIDMNPGEGLEKDAVFLSPHKFPGGPGASGLLILRNDVVRRSRPTWPGGGTVSFVSPWGHDYAGSLAAREEAGTPNVIGNIRAALAFIVKDAVGEDFIARRDRELTERAFAAWNGHPCVEILARDRRDRLPIFSIRLFEENGRAIHQQLATRMLSDLYGIQARGGCACAGPYAHRLLGIGRKASDVMRAAILSGREIEKPGWCRLNFSYLIDDETADFILRSVVELTEKAADYLPHYCCDEATARFRHENEEASLA